MSSPVFENVLKTARTNENLNVDLKNIFQYMESSGIGSSAEDDIKGLFDDVDTTSNKLGATLEEKNKRLADILIVISELNFGKYNDIDIFEDEYEFFNIKICL